MAQAYPVYRDDNLERVTLELTLQEANAMFEFLGGEYVGLELDEVWQALHEMFDLEDGTFEEGK
jgi:hypothetical protein